MGEMNKPRTISTMRLAHGFVNNARSGLFCAPCVHDEDAGMEERAVPRLITPIVNIGRIFQPGYRSAFPRHFVHCKALPFVGVDDPCGSVIVRHRNASFHEE